MLTSIWENVLSATRDDGDAAPRVEVNGTSPREVPSDNHNLCELYAGPGLALQAQNHDWDRAPEEEPSAWQRLTLVKV